MAQQLILKFRAAPVITAAIALAASALAQPTVVNGTGNPDVDIPAVQAAVNLGGEVVLSGHFSFDKPPTIPSPLQAVGFPQATVLISKAVAISGAWGSGKSSILNLLIEDLERHGGHTVSFNAWHHRE